MENSVNLNLNKAPSPNFDDKTSSSTTVVQKRKINMPHVGVVDVPKISSAPMHDTLVKAKQENPKMAYKLPAAKEKLKGIKTDFVLSGTVFACALITLIRFLLHLKKR